MNLIRWAFKVGSWQPTEHEWLKVSSCIQAEEKERIGRFVFRKDGKSSMCGRLLIRKFITEATSSRYADIELSRDEHGKPFLLSSEPVQFNVSHQGDFAVLVGVSNSARNFLGVDVMKVEYLGGKSLEEFFRIMARNFSIKEWSSIRSSGGQAERLLAFCRHWSLKESYVKATGTGITVNLQDISFQINSPLCSEVVTDTQLFVQGQLLRDWVFEESLLDSEHCVSVARNFAAETNKFQVLSFAEVTKCCEPLLPEDPDYCKAFFTKDERP